jgi:hypothetical protein
MVSPPATSEAGVHAAGDTKSEQFKLAGVGKLNEKHFNSDPGPKNNTPFTKNRREIVTMQKNDGVGIYFI